MTRNTLSSSDIRSVGKYFMIVATVELAADVGSIVRSIWFGDWVAFPGALVRTVLMGALAWLAIRRGSQVSRRLFAAGEFLTAGGALIFALFTIPAMAVTFEPTPFAVAVGYLLLGIGASVGTTVGRSDETSLH